jgi:hypothetical protein
VAYFSSEMLGVMNELQISVVHLRVNGRHWNVSANYAESQRHELRSTVGLIRLSFSSDVVNYTRRIV